MPRVLESQPGGRRWSSFGLILLRQLLVGFMILAVLGAIVMVFFASAMGRD
jgi:hypothetical protein